MGLSYSVGEIVSRTAVAPQARGPIAGRTVRMTQGANVNERASAVDLVDAGGLVKQSSQGVGEVRVRARICPRVRLYWVMWLLVAAHVAGLVFHPPGVRPTGYAWPGLASMWVSVWVSWIAVRQTGLRNLAVLLPAAAVAFQVAGVTYLGAVSILGGAAPSPSPADSGSLMFNLLLLAGLAVTVRNGPRGVASSVWLDSAVGTLGAASILAVLLSPVFGPSLAGSPSLSTVVTVIYPLSDLLLLAAIAGIAIVRGRRAGSHLIFLASGLAVFTATDTTYALQRNAGSFVLGTPLDAGWSIGLALIAMSVDRAARNARSTTPPQTDSATRNAALAVPTAASIAALGVLVLGTQERLSTIAVVLAAVTLLAASARSQLAFGHLAQMADRRRQEASTDHLTGLPNRRALASEARMLLNGSQHGQRAMLLLDLDKFKEVNDRLGHDVGDQLLIEMGARLRTRLRPGDLLARLGGDEFAVLLEDSDRVGALALATILEETCAEPFNIEGTALETHVSIGIALFPGDGLSLGSLLHKADIAMYRAKTLGTGHHLYDGTSENENSVYGMPV